ncbi:MAG: HEPN domain-containing protein [Ignavibacteriales bacterium]|nr:HEPN domain-containing protein [Ignavibacteriales bacterium]
MQSFRTELENLHKPVVERDIIDLEKKIRLYREGRINDEKFRSLRLARGVYGQRQPGVQMVRIKIPFGRMTVKQLLTIADIAEEYGNGNLHATTRQDIQIHYVSLDKTPELWARLERDDVTLREACGNTVRNITASATAGIDPKEPFDVSPYAYSLFKYFLRNPICQELGRKFKIAFSSGDDDTAFAFIHDIGFIPKIKNENGKEIRGFKVVIGGGLGSQPMLAVTAYEFLAEQFILPYSEAILRLFDRYGERKNRSKARMKFLLEKIGFDEMKKLVHEEWNALNVKEYWVDRDIVSATQMGSTSKVVPISPNRVEPTSKDKFKRWRETNVFEQKQKGFYGVYVRVPLGNFHAQKARLLAEIARLFAADDIRVTVNQGYLLKFVRPENLPALFHSLNEIDLAEAGFDSTNDITACPGTDTCNLGISDSTSISLEFEKVIAQEYPDLIYNNNIKIKISGCPNSCGQHGLASIGFHGSSFRVEKNSLPALQVVLGGGRLGNGEGIISEKVIKIPSKRGPDSLRLLLDDYFENQNEGEYYEQYYRRKGKEYFYTLLKPLADLTSLVPADFVDWGHDEQFKLKTEAGECAGVIIDLVSTLLYETEEKLGWARETFEANRFADSIYHGYNVFVNGAKAMLLKKDLIVNTQYGILKDFEEKYAAEFQFPNGFKEFILRINKNEPTKEFAEQYLNDAAKFLETIQSINAEKHETAEV